MKIRHPPSSTQASSHSTSHRKLTDNDELQRARKEARKEANEERTKAQQEIRDTQIILDDSLKELREQYERQSLTESARMDALLEQQRSKGYENLRDLQRAQRTEMMRIKREGEKQIQELKDYYQKEIVDSDRMARQELTNLQKKHFNEMTTESATAKNEIEQAKINDSMVLQRYKDASDSRLFRANEAYQKEYERLKLNTQEAKTKSEEDFQRQFDSLHERHTSLLDRLRSESEQQITDVRIGTSRKIEAYLDRQRDPFYQHINLDSQLFDNGDHYVLKANIPEHEQDNVSVVISGNQMQLQVQRRNEERIELEPGHKQSTNSYQTFRESFPLSFPVDSKSLTKTFDGTQLIATVSKSGMVYRSDFAATRAPERVKVERPRLPNNLFVKEDKLAENEEIPQPSKSAGLGGRTLG